MSKSKAPVKMTSAQIARILELHHAGVSPYSISKQLNIPSGVSLYHINKYRVRQLEIAVSNQQNPKTQENQLTFNDDSLIDTIRLHIERLEHKKRVLKEFIERDLVQ